MHCWKLYANHKQPWTERKLAVVKIASAQARDLYVQMLPMHKLGVEMYASLHLDILDILKCQTEWFSNAIVQIAFAVL